MRPVSWMRLEMVIPPAMDERQYWHESTLEHSTVDTEITELAKSRDIKSQV